MANVRTPQEREGDLQAQVAANRKGVKKLAEMAEHYGVHETTRQMDELLAYTERITRKLLVTIPDGSYSFADYLDDDDWNLDLYRLRSLLYLMWIERLLIFPAPLPVREV
jgi:N-methylhydantoinase B